MAAPPAEQRLRRAGTHFQMGWTCATLAAHEHHFISTLIIGVCVYQRLSSNDWREMRFIIASASTIYFMITTHAAALFPEFIENLPRQSTDSTKATRPTLIIAFEF